MGAFEHRGSRIASCTGIWKRFGDGEQGRWVLGGIDLGIEAGQVTLLTGPSGCGKTTLVSILGGLMRPTKGEVELLGTRIYGLDRENLSAFRLHNVGFVFQQANLIPSITAAENAGIALAAAGYPRMRAASAGRALLGRLGLGDSADRLPSQLSGGQQQRVAIARAIALGPRLLVCDEPTSSLDAGSGRTVMRVLREAAVDTGTAVLVVTHDNRVHAFADRIVSMDDGLITGDDTTPATKEP